MNGHGQNTAAGPAVTEVFVQAELPRPRHEERGRERRSSSVPTELRVRTACGKAAYHVRHGRRKRGMIAIAAVCL